MSASLLRIPIHEPIHETGDAAGQPPQAADQLANVWRADQLGSWQSVAVATGHDTLDRELPNGGWPSAALTELMLQQPGIGEMRLLLPAFGRIAKHRSIALVQPPYLPQATAWASWQLPAEQLLWIRTSRALDALWAAEQILRNGSCGALVLWQTHIRHESLRRLHLAAQASDMLFWLMRPLTAAQDASPAPLRLCLRPAVGGIDIEILKRRGPQRDGSLFLPLGFVPALRSVQRGSASSRPGLRVAQRSAEAIEGECKATSGDRAGSLSSIGPLQGAPGPACPGRSAGDDMSSLSCLTAAIAFERPAEPVNRVEMRH